MKIKKIKKILKRECNNVIEKMNSPKGVITNDSKGFLFVGSEYNEAVSNKFKKMIKSIMKFDNISINMRNDSINIYTNDIKTIKKASTLNSNTVNSTNDYLEINIVKDGGFTINYKNYSLSFKDTHIYYEIFDESKEKFNTISCQIFHNMYNDFVKESGLLRDNNLEEIFNE